MGLFAGICSFIFCFWHYHWIPEVAGTPTHGPCPPPQPRRSASFPHRCPLLVCLFAGLEQDGLRRCDHRLAWPWAALNFNPKWWCFPMWGCGPGPCHTKITLVLTNKQAQNFIYMYICKVFESLFLGEPVLHSEKLALFHWSLNGLIFYKISM